MQLTHLSKKDRARLLAYHTGRWLGGQCFILAIALHREAGYEIMAMKKRGSNRIMHAFVVTPRATFFDGRGEVKTFEALASHYGDAKNFELVPNITEQDLQKIEKTEEFQIQSAVECAQLFWPELPWKTEKVHDRMRQFLTRLEALSQEYGFWIRPQCDTERPAIDTKSPLIYQGDEDGEEEYVCTLTSNGTNYLLSRGFKDK